MWEGLTLYKSLKKLTPFKEARDTELFTCVILIIMSLLKVCIADCSVFLKLPKQLQEGHSPWAVGNRGIRCSNTSGLISQRYLGSNNMSHDHEYYLMGEGYDLISSSAK